ncbi:type II toxin-antitoxin system RelE family toxin [Aeromonas hydrophila]|uniref:type II toxin-antitoxin system RelE family toxin n=1 Tax=Aeromonas hydrophila TaxID=644 RepID=UPI003D23FD4B
MNTLRWSKKAEKQLKKLPADDKKNVYHAAQALLNFPECRNVKSLTNHQYGFRLRVGRYRVLFDFDGEVRIVSIEEVLKRNESTY